VASSWFLFFSCHNDARPNTHCCSTASLDAEGEQYFFSEMWGMSTSFVFEVCVVMGSGAVSLGIGYLGCALWWEVVLCHWVLGIWGVRCDGKWCCVTGYWVFGVCVVMGSGAVSLDIGYLGCALWWEVVLCHWVLGFPRYWGTDSGIIPKGRDV